MKRKDRIDLTEEERKKCMAIIHGASVAAGGVGTGLAQLPLADSAVITPIQVAMIISLGKVFERKITKAGATAVIGSAGAALLGRGISQVLVGWIPGVGNAINTATAAGITEAIGWIAVERFSREKNSESAKKTGEENIEQEETETVVPEEQQELIPKINCFLKGEKAYDRDKKEYDQLFSTLHTYASADLLHPSLQEIYEKLRALRWEKTALSKNYGKELCKMYECLDGDWLLDSREDLTEAKDIIYQLKLQVGKLGANKVLKEDIKQFEELYRKEDKAFRRKN